MYRTVWEMYGNKFSIKFFRMKIPLNLNVMYITVVELEEFYLCNKDNF